MSHNSAKSEAAALALSALTVAFFVLLPRYRETHVTHTSYTLGWPFPADALYVGYVSPESPSGLRLEFDPFFVLNAILWLVVLLGLRRLARAGFLSHRVILACLLLALFAGGVWFAFGAASIMQVLALNSQ